MNAATREIIATSHAAGCCHDFKLFQTSVGAAVGENVKILADSGYQGISRIHENSETPKKKPKGGELTEVEKAGNRLIAAERVPVENVIAKIKVFKIFANKYRNRRRRFALRMSLVCGIINSEHN